MKLGIDVDWISWMIGWEYKRYLNRWLFYIGPLAVWVTLVRTRRYSRDLKRREG